MIGAIIGGALGIASSIYGGYQAEKAAKKDNAIEQANYDKQSRENRSWYDRRYNEDGTQRAYAQRILTMTQDAIRRRNRAAQGASAVSGASEESVAATKQANADALADATSKIAVASEARKDAIEDNYLARKNALDDSHTKYGVGIEQQRAQNLVTAASGAAQAAASLGGSVDTLTDSLGGSTAKTASNVAQTTIQKTPAWMNTPKYGASIYFPNAK